MIELIGTLCWLIGIICGILIGLIQGQSRIKELEKKLKEKGVGN